MATAEVREEIEVREEVTTKVVLTMSRTEAERLLVFLNLHVGGGRGPVHSALFQAIRGG